MSSRFALSLLLAALGVAACSSEQVYNATSEWRAQECARLEERDRADCSANARTPYSQYKKDRDATTGTDAPKPAGS